MTALRTIITTTVLSSKQSPVAVLRASPDFGIIGSIVRLDGTLSSDPDNSPLTYAWSFVSVPIGSRVEAEAFRVVESDGSVVSFSPDQVGEYVLQLIVSNGIFDSQPSQSVVSIRAVLVPHAQGIVPDGKWLWQYIRDIWFGVENKEIFETLWSALIQMTGAELLKLYQVDFNKSIRDIQDYFQRRWLSYEPRLNLDASSLSFYFGNHYAGNSASTVNLGTQGAVAILSATDLYVVEGSVLQNVAGVTLNILSSRDSANVGSYTLTGLNAAKNGYSVVASAPVPDPAADIIDTSVHFLFDAQSTTWNLTGARGKNYAELMMEHGSPLDYLLPFWINRASSNASDAQVGDVIQIKAGPNKGLYRIIAQSGSFYTVDKAPPVASTVSSPYTADIFRPVPFTIEQADALLTDTLSIPYDATSDVSALVPGRLILINGQAYTIVRAMVDTHQRIPTTVVVVDRPLLQSGLANLSWRTPPTLVSSTQNFEELGVTTGDVLYVTVSQGSTSVQVPVQVVGVDRNRIGVAFSTELLQAGQVPEVSNSIYLSLASGFGISSVSENYDGTLSFAGTAQTYLDSLNSQKFKNLYWNTELTPGSEISVNPVFKLAPSYIIRNRLIPVDDSLRSVPLLQNFIVQPVTVSQNGVLYQQKNGQLYEMDHAPELLKENVDFVVDGETAFDGTMGFLTGTDIVQVDGADFIDKGIVAGDQFIITEPATFDRTYYIKAVISPTEIQLTRSLPLNSPDPFLSATVTIRRTKKGRFIRMVPGRFTSLNPAPDRLWAEVSFFDNNENIENNFGILVGLTREDVEKVSSSLKYRQAVAGIMYAYLQGAALGKIRIGAQILLGLPFAESRGIVRSIDPTYRLNDSGSPIAGRILVEDVDHLGTALGTLRVYTYPIDPISVLAGLDINPATSKEYVVGDIVEQFAPLSKGVEISDYVSTKAEGMSTSRQLQQYHSMRLRVEDGAFTLAELGLVSQFLKKITPSYVAFFLSSLSEFEDTVALTDVPIRSVRFGEGALVDNASLCMAPTIMEDSRNPSGVHPIVLNDGVYWCRRTGKDLATTNGSSVVSIPSGGVLAPKTHELFEAPLTRAGDVLLIRTGLSTGYYPITAVTDTTVTVSGMTNGFSTESGLLYAILRKYKTVIRTASATMTNGSANVRFGTGGLRTDGVASGDYLLNTAGLAGPKRFTIISVFENTPGSGVFDTVSVTPTPTVSSTSTFTIARAKVFESPFPDESVVLTSTGGGSTFTVPAGSLTPSLMDAGDELVIQTGTRAGQSFFVIDPQNNYITPAMVGATETVKLTKKNRVSTGVGWDAISLWDPTDSADIALKESNNLASCTASSKNVSLQMQRVVAPASGPTAVNPNTLHVRPGDMLKLSGSGNGAVNLGYGAGIYPIAVVTGSNVQLTVNLTNTESVAWSIIRRR